jgi:quinol monooxygenase YgiN
MSPTVKVIAVLSAKDGQGPALENLLRGMVAPSRAEPGNLRYDLWRDADHVGRFVIDEVYRDADAAASHRTSAHYQHYLSQINDLAERAPHVVQPVDVADT